MESRSKFRKDGASEEFETEAEKQLKTLLRKQINTETNLQNELFNRKEFISASTYHPTTEKFRGEVSLEKFSNLEKQDKKYESLKECGLTDDEIKLKLGSNSCKRKGTVNPDVRDKQLKYIDERISNKLKTLDAPDTFSGKRRLGRHEMDLEASLIGKLDSKKAQVFKTLTTEAKADDRPVSSRHPMFRIKQLADDLFREKFDENQEDSDCESVESERGKKHSLPAHEFIGPVKPISNEEIGKNRASLEEIRNLPRFKNYSPGEKSDILYLKNLPNNVCEADLVSLFVRFQKADGPKILYRLLYGKMKGQAFITFDSADTASDALQQINGYRFNGRPMIIQYGKGKNSK